MVRLLIEDVTLVKKEQITAHIRFKGGAQKTMMLPRPLSAFMSKKTPSEIVKEIDCLLDDYRDSQIASILNQKGLRTGCMVPFTTEAIFRIRQAYGLKDHSTRLRERGFLTNKEMLEKLNTTEYFLKKGKDDGLIFVRQYNDRRNAFLYKPPDENLFCYGSD